MSNFKKKKQKISSHQGLSLVRAHFFSFLKLDKIWMILGFFEGENFHIYKYKMAKNTPGGWLFFRVIFSSKKVKNGLPPGRILNVFFGKKKAEILRKNPKMASHLVWFWGGGFTPRGGFYGITPPLNSLHFSYKPISLILL